ncbi:MAG TPA: hypothetical protein VFY23_01595 [Candidatus Limnocylindrales bacterium]|nr:hypothetical protein [Candidatus Limnocylindrales bacterium]
MQNRSPLPIIGAAIVVVLVLVAGGTAFGFGPLAGTQPPSEVTDPKEMVARSLQAVLDAEAVHLEGQLSGTIPGELVERDEPAVSLDGSTVSSDVRPKDAKTSTRLTSPGLEADVAAVTVWDGVWFRTAPDDPWQKASLGGASAQAGVDINPLTLVERLRSYLATPGIAPVLEEIECASTSGQCHRVTIEAGRDPAQILRAMLPADQAGDLPDVRTTIVLDTDALTLRPAALAVDSVSDDGSIDIHLELDASRWDDPSIVVEEPATGA